jgi:hypothetical protein
MKNLNPKGFKKPIQSHGLPVVVGNNKHEISAEIPFRGTGEFKVTGRYTTNIPS